MNLHVETIPAIPAPARVGQRGRIVRARFNPRVVAGRIEVRGRVTDEGSLPGDLMTTTAHPHGDFSRNRIVNVGTSFGVVSEMVAYEHSSQERRRQVIGRWRPRRLAYAHSFGLSLATYCCSPTPSR